MARGRRAGWQSHAEQPRFIPSESSLTSGAPTRPSRLGPTPPGAGWPASSYPERGWRGAEPDPRLLGGKLWMQAWLNAINITNR